MRLLRSLIIVVGVGTVMSGVAVAQAAQPGPFTVVIHSPGVISSKMARSRPKSLDTSEYAGEIGACGIPA